LVGLTLDPACIPVGGVFDVSFLVVLIVNVDHTKSGIIASSPLKVVHDGPGEVASHIHPIFLHGGLHVLDVLTVVFGPEGVMKSILNRHVVLIRAGDSILEDVHLLVTVSGIDPVEDLPHAFRIHVEPASPCIRPNQLPVNVVLTGPEPSIISPVPSLFSGVVNELGSVVVQPNEVEGAFHQLGLFLSEGRHPPINFQLNHGIWVLSKDKRIIVPTKVILYLGVGSINIILAIGVPRLSKLGLGTHPNDPSLGLLVLLSVGPDSLGMSKDHIVRSDVWFCGSITAVADPAAVPRNVVAAPSWCLQANAISQPGEGEGLIEGDPVLDSVSKGAEAQVRIVIEVILDVRIKPSVFGFILHKTGRKIPVVQGNEWFNTGFQKLVYHVIVEGNSSPVDAVGGTVREESGPREGEPEVLDPQLPHHLDVHLVLVVEVVGYVSGVSIVDPSRNSHKVVPDVGTFSILIPSPFDLVRSGSSSPSKVSRIYILPT